ncbi:MAG: fused MFS/spermidine synthase [Syntrophobacteria bacterium]
MNISYALSFALIGFASTIAQIIALRELLTVFSGSELAVAIVVAAWLFWTAAGSMAGGKISHRLHHRQVFFAWLQTASGLVLIGTVFLFRIARALFQVGAGELVTLEQMLAASFLTVAPFCLTAGFLFSLACLVLAARMPVWTRSPGLVYFLEGLGAGMGGLLFCLFLVHRFNVVQILSGVALCLWASGLLMSREMMRFRWLRACVLVAVFLGLVLVQHQSQRLNLESRQWQWPDFRLLDSEETAYGHIVVLAREEQRSFFENGLWNFTVPDRLTAEKAVHFALLQHPQPRTVLLIGGGVSGSLNQSLQHPSIQRVDYVELDPRLIEIAKSYLPDEVTAALDDPRVEVHHEDGRLYLARSTRLYDVILINLPEPFTAQLNRFYSREFLRLAAEKLNKRGICFFSASGAETALGPIQARYLKLLHRTATSVFPSVVVFPGQTVRFFCSNDTRVLTTDPEILVQRLRRRGLELLYVQDYYILWDLSRPRQQSFMEMIGRADESSVNTDLNPRAYFYNLLLWGSQYSPLVLKLFGALSQRIIWYGLIVLCALTAVLSWALRQREPSPRLLKMRILYAVGVFGLTEISLEIVIVFAFQIFFGYLYYKIGLLVTFYMVGLALGSFTLSYYPKRREAQMRALIIVQSILALFCLALALTVLSFHKEPAVHEHFLYREAFTLMSLAAGFLGGTHFPLANRLFVEQRDGVGRTAGLIYAVDLLGSFLGSLTVGLLLIPIAGILQSLAILAVANVTAILLLVGSRAGPLLSSASPGNF